MPAISLLASTARGSSGCWRAKASSRWVEVVAAHRSAAAAASRNLSTPVSPLPARAPDDLQRSGDDRQHVVEVVGDAAGELAHRLHLLRLPELRLDLFALLRLFLQLLVGQGELIVGLRQLAEGAPREIADHGGHGADQQENHEGADLDQRDRSRRLGAPVCHELVFRRRHRHDMRLDRLHQLHAGIGVDGGHGGVAPAGGRVVDRGLEFGQLPADQVAKLHQRRRLRRIVLHQFAGLGEQGWNLSGCGLVGRKVDVAARQQEAPLAAFGAAHQDQHLRQLIAHQQGMPHPLALRGDAGADPQHPGDDGGRQRRGDEQIAV